VTRSARAIPGRLVVAGITIGVAIAMIVYFVTARRGESDTAPATAFTTSVVRSDVLVPSGTAAVGCDPIAATACPDSAWPPHRVKTTAFRIDRNEVTVADYRRCVQATACTVEGVTFDNFECNWAEAGRDEHPINCVSWQQADGYCRWARRSLPTEQQWERAALHREGAPFPWGAEEPTCQVTVMTDDEGPGCGRGLTWRVSSRPLGASRVGAVDMAGNVREWVADVYKKPTKAARRPRKKDDGSIPRVVRGGGWKDGAKSQHVATRWHMLASERAIDVGFRCVREIK